MIMGAYLIQLNQALERIAPHFGVGCDNLEIHITETEAGDFPTAIKMKVITDGFEGGAAALLTDVVGLPVDVVAGYLIGMGIASCKPVDRKL